MYIGLENKKARRKAVPVTNRKELLFLIVVFAFGRCGFALSLSLRLRLFHSLLGFGGFFGADFGAFFFLLVENFLAAQQFEECLIGAVALVPVSADDARVPA